MRLQQSLRRENLGRFSPFRSAGCCSALPTSFSNSPPDCLNAASPHHSFSNPTCGDPYPLTSDHCVCGLSQCAGDGGIRTRDPLLAGQVLSQLSYTPVLCRSLKIEQQNAPRPCGSSARTSVLLRKEVIQPHLPIRLPCYDLTPIIEPTFDCCLLAVSSQASGVPNFHGLTGGVYKARERIHRGMLIRDY